MPSLSTEEPAMKAKERERPQAVKPQAKPEVGERPGPQEADGRVMALALPEGELSEEMRAYFAKCDEKIGFVPNVLRAYAHDDAKLAAFAGFYNDLMLAPSGLSKLEREMIAVVVSSQNRCYYCLTAHGAALRGAGFSERDIWDIAAVASFFNMSNRMASAVDMRPNRPYHGQARDLG